jgi:hypothetical protein
MTKPPAWKRGPTPVGAFVAGLVEPALARQGLGEISLLTDWSEIAGARLAAVCRPIEVQWPRAARRGAETPGALATLVLRVEGAFALEAQHSAAILIERVNAHLGWRCIGKVALRQGPIAAPPRRARPAPPSAEALAWAERQIGPLHAEPLREALARLGARVIDKGGASR